MLPLSIYFTICIVASLILSSSQQYRDECEARGKNPAWKRFEFVATSPIWLPISLFSAIVTIIKAIRKM